MPRGRPAGVRYFLDQITGNVVALGSGMMRVLQEIGGTSAQKKSTNGRRTKKRRRAVQAPAGAPAAETATAAPAKRIGRPPGSKNKKKSANGRKKGARGKKKAAKAQ